MLTHQEVWTLYGHYVEAWKPISSEQRAKLLAEALDPKIQYFTPHFQGGLSTVLEDIEAFQVKYPGCYFDVDDISTHHDVALFTWVLIQPDGTALVKGHDQIRISAEGRIAAITTFSPSTPKP